MKLARLRGMCNRLGDYYQLNQTVSTGIEQDLMSYFSGFLQSFPAHDSHSDDCDIEFSLFARYCREHSFDRVFYSLSLLSEGNLLRRAFDSWRFNYRNEETFSSWDDVLDIPYDSMVILDGEVYTVDELKASFNLRPAPGWCRSSFTGRVFSDSALTVLELHQDDELRQYAAAMRSYCSQITYDNPIVLAALQDLLMVYYEQGSLRPDRNFLSYSEEALNVCSDARAAFLELVYQLPLGEQNKFLDTVIHLNFGGNEPVINSVRDVFGERSLYCIKMEQVRLWVFLLTQRPGVGCPSMLKGLDEAQGLILPAGAQWWVSSEQRESDSQRGLHDMLNIHGNQLLYQVNLAVGTSHQASPSGGNRRGRGVSTPRQASLFRSNQGGRRARAAEVVRHHQPARPY